MADRPTPPPPPPPVVCNACQEITNKQRKHCKHCEWWYCPVCHALNSKTDFNPPADIAGSHQKVVEWAKDRPVIEIRADDVPKLLAVFKPPKDKDARAEAMIRVRPVFTVKPPNEDALVATSQDGSAAPVVMAEVVFSDADGLFDGQSLSVPALSTDVPDVRTIIAGALTRDPWLWEIEATLSQDFMGKLSAACKAYGAHAQLRYVQYSAGRIGMVGTVGEKLAAFQVVAPVETNPNGVPWPEITRREWAARLRGLTVADQVSTWLMTVTAPTRDDEDESPSDDDTPVTPLPGQQEEE